MKLGFDLDGTLDHPPILSAANQAFDQGHEVHVISGYVPGTAYGYQGKIDKLQALGARYTKFHLAVGMTYEAIGMEKARIILQNGISQMVDDSPIFVDIMRRMTPAKVFQVTHTVGDR